MAAPSKNQQIANRQSAILIVALNNSDAPAALTLPVAALGLADGTVLADALDGGQAVVSGGQMTVALAARSGAAMVEAGG